MGSSSSLPHRRAVAHPDPLARGAFVGLTLAHDRRHLTRAVLEGVAFGLRDGLDLMIEAGMPAPSTIRASGGGPSSPVWRQILADVLGAEIATVNTTEGAAYGAGLLAAVGAGWYRSVEDAAATSCTRRRSRLPGRTPPATPTCTRSIATSIRHWRRRSGGCEPELRSALAPVAASAPSSPWLPGVAPRSPRSAGNQMWS